jgi:hypothetical protein
VKDLLSFILVTALVFHFDEIEGVRMFLSELGPSFNPGNVQRQSILAADCLEWCIRVVRLHYVATAQSSHASYYGSALDSAGGGAIDEKCVFDDDDDDFDDDDDDSAWSDDSENKKFKQKLKKNFKNKQQDTRRHPSSIAYVNGTPKQSLAVRVMMMDPNPDYGGQPKAKSPKTAPLHRRNDVGPQPVRQQVFKSAARDYLSTGEEDRGGRSTGGGSASGSRVGPTPTTGRTERSSIAGWSKSRGSVKGNRSGDSRGVVHVNKW